MVYIKDANLEHKVLQVISEDIIKKVTRVAVWFRKNLEINIYCNNERFTLCEGVNLLQQCDTLLKDYRRIDYSGWFEDGCLTIYYKKRK